MKIIWTKIATQQRARLLAARKDYAGTASARKAFEEINRILALAAAYPEMGKSGMVEGTRELFPLRYRVVYQCDEKSLYVVAILPQWQKWPVDEL